jgi:coenzyme F420 hydrogenase subunit beta
MASGALTLEPAPADRLARSQPNLVQTRGAVWGRIQAMRVLGLSVPRYEHVRTFPAWWRHLDTRAKARSVLGSARRIRRDRLRRPRTVIPLAGPPSVPVAIAPARSRG